MQWRNNNTGTWRKRERKIWCMTQNISDGINKFFSSSFHSFRYFCLFYFSVNITVSYALRVVTSKWSLIYVQQPLVILFPKNIYSYIHIKSYKKETIMMMWCHTLFSMSSPSTFNYQHSTIFSTFILMCLLDVQ